MARRMKKGTYMTVESLSKSTTAIMDEFTEPANQYDHMVIRNLLTYVSYDEENKKSCYEVSLVVSKCVDALRLVDCMSEITMTAIKKKLVQSKISEKLSVYEEEDCLPNIIKRNLSKTLRDVKVVHNNLVYELYPVTRLKAQTSVNRKNAEVSYYYITGVMLEKSKYNHYY